ncbi:Uncharacterized protein HZ326_21634 [Fusarium oxysporum f. sp. albedinis]|nr:Uncharacterized protein HZ326_21634 [Fusarium oxysporum f. sp. albedinis]
MKPKDRNHHRITSQLCQIHPSTTWYSPHQSRKPQNSRSEKLFRIRAPPHKRDVSSCSGTRGFLVQWVTNPLPHQ